MKQLEHNVKELNFNERIDEVAELISGQEITDASRKQAQELLKFYG